MIALGIATFVVAFLLTGYVLRLARGRGWLDVPNHRSSHETPTPRGGGIGIVFATEAALIFSYPLGWITGRLLIAFAVGGVMVAAVGWIDDRRSVSPWIRAGVHFGAAIWALAWIGGLPSIDIVGWTMRSTLLTNTIAVLAIVWATNLYNFMDGIDGIAGVEGLTVGVLGALVFMLTSQSEAAVVSLVLGAACGGFLVWNWAPARIFMGDVGSGFVGFLFACIAVSAERSRPESLLWVLLLAGVFVFDATATIIRRTLAGEQIYGAHRLHAYQRQVGAGMTHAQVSTAVAAANVVLAAFVIMAVRHHSSRAIPIAGCLVLLSFLYAIVERRNPMYSNNRK